MEILDQIEKIFKSDKIQGIFKKNIEKAIRTKGHRCRYKVNEAVYQKEIKKLNDNINRLQLSLERLQSVRIDIANKENAE